MPLCDHYSNLLIFWGILRPIYVFPTFSIMSLYNKAHLPDSNQELAIFEVISWHHHSYQDQYKPNLSWLKTWSNFYLIWWLFKSMVWILLFFRFHVKQYRNYVTLQLNLDSVSKIFRIILMLHHFFFNKTKHFLVRNDHQRNYCYYL